MLSMMPLKCGVNSRNLPGLPTRRVQAGIALLIASVAGKLPQFRTSESPLIRHGFRAGQGHGASSSLDQVQADWRHRFPAVASA